MSSTQKMSLTLNSDFLIWFILHRITDGKYTSVRGAVVVSVNRIVYTGLYCTGLKTGSIHPSGVQW